MIINHPQKPFTIGFHNVETSARLLAFGSTGGLPPSHQDVSRQWLNTSLQPPSPITAAGPPRSCTVFRYADATMVKQLLHLLRLAENSGHL